jgi:hypothetical protein
MAPLRGLLVAPSAEVLIDGRQSAEGRSLGGRITRVNDGRVVGHGTPPADVAVHARLRSTGAPRRHESDASPRHPQPLGLPWHPNDLVQPGMLTDVPLLLEVMDGDDPRERIPPVDGSRRSTREAHGSRPSRGSMSASGITPSTRAKPSCSSSRRFSGLNGMPTLWSTGESDRQRLGRPRQASMRTLEASVDAVDGRDTQGGRQIGHRSHCTDPDIRGASVAAAQHQRLKSREIDTARRPF